MTKRTSRKLVTCVLSLSLVAYAFPVFAASGTSNVTVTVGMVTR